MKYMIMLFGDESGFENMSEEDMATMMQAHEEFDSWCEANGVTVTSGEELTSSTSAITFAADGAETDGPFLEIKEQIGGYYVIEVDSLDKAKETARRTPNYGHVELRPVVDHSED